MNKINFENYPSEETPLSAENLNAIQDNIETAISNIEIAIQEEKDNIEFQHKLLLKIIDYRFDKDVLWEIEMTETEIAEDLEQRNKDLAIIILKLKRPELENQTLTATKFEDNIYQILTFRINIKTYEIVEV